MTLPLIAIVGRPNVGKSTLFNRLVGGRRALVQDRPGVTRDRQYAEADWDGVNFKLIDTGGLEFETRDKLQKKMSDQAFHGIEEADCILCLMDGRAGITTLDREWVECIRKIEKPKIFLINKIDSEKLENLLSEFFELGVEPLYPVSAETGRGVGELLDHMVSLVAVGRGTACRAPTSDEKRETPVRRSLGEGGSDEFTISLIGRPNVGKSTLLNKLLGEERAIVDEKPGTTRDPINSYLSYEGCPLCLIDTAGIRRKGKTKEAIEKFSIIKSLKSIEQADLALLLLDSTEGVTDQDAHIAGEAFERNKALILLVNKWDEGEKKGKRDEFLEALQRKLHFAVHSPILFISAKTGKNVEKIFPTLLRIKEQYEQKVQTSALNKEFERIIAAHPLPVYRGRNIKIYYATQVGTKPPTFIVFSNEPGNIHFSYQRYLNNSLKKAFGFKEVPVKIVYRKR